MRGALSDAQVARFHEQGYLCVERVFDDDDIAPLRAEYVSLLDEVAQTKLLTVWVAISDATLENACLVCVAGSHRNGLTPHRAGITLASEPHFPPECIDAANVRALPIGRGGVILFDKCTHHASLPNRSKRLR